VCGVLTPMLEVEARISQLRFMLMGYPVEFSNEVFYFQSKSILGRGLDSDVHPRGRHGSRGRPADDL
jgi:hypothetical protein